MRMTHNALAKIIIAIEGIDFVGKLHTCRVECRIPQFVYFYLSGSIVEKEYFNTQYGIGCFLGKYQPLGSRGIGLCCRLVCIGAVCTSA